MNSDTQFNKFFQPELKLTAETIQKGGVIFFVGINGRGKTLLSELILSNTFARDFFTKRKVHRVLISFKDRVKPTSEEIYKYWLEETAKVLGGKVTFGSNLNNFTFNAKMSEMISTLAKDEKICFVILDAHEILDQSEVFFTSLYYLYNYSLNRVSYIILSEPHILFSQNPAAKTFIEWFSSFKFHFLRSYDEETARADVDHLGKILEFDFSKYKKMIVKYGRGLHSAMRAFCNLIKASPEITNLKLLKKAIYSSSFVDLWIKEILDSLPPQSVRILKEVIESKDEFQKYQKDIYGKYLIDLGFVKPRGTFNYPLIAPILARYSHPAEGKVPILKFYRNSFIINGDKVKLAKKEKAVLALLYKKKGKLVTNDDIAEVLWQGNAEQFSLWAIRQIVKRIRKRLSFYLINPKVIQSVRGEGYKLN